MKDTKAFFCDAFWHGWRNLFQSGGSQVHVKKKL